MSMPHCIRTSKTARRWAGISVFVLALILTLAGEAQAQRITLKRPFFSGWRYSIDGGEYKRLGSGTELKTMMADSRACLGAMKSFSDHATAAKITGILGILLVAWPISTQLRGKDWADSYTPMVIVGGSFGVVSLAMEAAGSRNLKRAVMIHNRIHGYGDDFDARLPTPSGTLRLTLRF